MSDEDEEVQVEVGYRVEATKDHDRVGILTGMVGMVVDVVFGQSFTVVFPELTSTYPHGITLYWLNRKFGFKVTPDST